MRLQIPANHLLFMSKIYLDIIYLTTKNFLISLLPFGFEHPLSLTGLFRTC